MPTADKKSSGRMASQHKGEFNENGDDEDMYDPGRGSPDYRKKPGLFSFVNTMYFRYKVMTGVYMLGPGEEMILHFFFILGAYFTVTYGIQFWYDMGQAGYN